MSPTDFMNQFKFYLKTYRESRNLFDTKINQNTCSNNIALIKCSFNFFRFSQKVFEQELLRLQQYITYSDCLFLFINPIAYRPGYINLKIGIKIAGAYLIPCLVIFLLYPLNTFYQQIFSLLIVSITFFAVNIIYLYWERKETDELSKVAIYGAGVAGRNLAKDLFLGSKYKPICFIDDNLKKDGDFIYGLKVYSFKSFLTSSLKNNINGILVAIPSLNEIRKTEILRQLSKEKFSVRILPDWDQLTDNNPTAFQLKMVNFADMFSREEADLDIIKSDDYFLIRLTKTSVKDLGVI